MEEGCRLGVHISLRSLHITSTKAFVVVGNMLGLKSQYTVYNVGT